MPLRLRSIFLPLAGERGDHLLGVAQRLLAVEDRLQLLEPLEPAADRPEIGECAAQPPLGHVRHPAPLAFLDDRLGRLPLGSHEQDQAVRGGDPVEELGRAQQAADGLLQVDDVNQVPLAVDVRLHLRVPAAGPVAEMHAGVDQVFHDECHATTSAQSLDDSSRAPGAKGPGRPC